MGDLLWRQLRLRTKFHPALPGGFHAGAGALGNQAAFQFGQDADHLPHGAAGGRLGVNVFGQGAKLDAVGAQIVQQGDEVAQTAA
jgi:hypothetical protein